MMMTMTTTAMMMTTTLMTTMMMMTTVVKTNGPREEKAYRFGRTNSFLYFFSEEKKSFEHFLLGFSDRGGDIGWVADG